MTRAILIAGPTASGKSAAAIALAERRDGTVINADSMQVYRELSLLTARPALAERADIPHRLYGTVTGAEAYSVGQWIAAAAAAIAEARSANRVPILVGGTGLYFKALLEGLSPVPEIPPETRRFWRGRASEMGPEELHGELASRDPAMAAKLEASDAQRIVRALEVIDATGVSLAEWQRSPGTPAIEVQGVRKLVIALERERLYDAIDRRVDWMLDVGAIEEVRTLMTLELDPGLPLMRALGVRELCAYLTGNQTLEQAAIETKTATRRYAKRQLTWAKRFMSDWEWVPDCEAAMARLSITP